MHVLEGVILPPEMRAAMEATPEPTAEPTPEETVVAGTAAEHPDLVTLLENDAAGRFTILVSAIHQTHLNSVLRDVGPFTLLAPTNDAFTAALEAMGMTQDDLFADGATLSQILSYHVISGKYFFRNLTSGPTLDTLLQGQQVTFDLTDGIFTVEGVNILDTDNLASNGIMHVLEGVMLPPDIRAAMEATPEPTAVPTATPTLEPTPEPTVVTGTAAERPDLMAMLENDADGRFTTLVAAIDAAGLRQNLVGGPFTLLAPTNDAFTAALEAMGMTPEDAMASPDLASILLYHVLPGRYFFRNLTSGPTIPTLLEGQSVTFDLTDGVFTVEGVNILDTDNLASNGIMHVLEGVMLPPEMRAALEATPEPTAEPTAAPTQVAGAERPNLLSVLQNDADGRFTTFLTAVDAAGLTHLLSETGPYTLLAPTNDAITALLDAAGLTVEDVVADTDALTRLVQYHVIPGQYFFRNLTSGPTLLTALQGQTVTFSLADGVFTVQGANILDTDNLASNGVMHVLEGVMVPPALAEMFAPLNANIRFAHFSPDAGGVDIYINGELSALTNVAFAVVGDWMPVASGTFEIGVAPTGGEPTVTGSVDVAEGAWVTIAVTGLIAESNVSINPFVENFAPLEEGTARVDVFNAIWNSPPYDVAVDGNFLVVRLGYPLTLDGNDGYDTFDLPAGTYHVQFLVTGQANFVILDLPEVVLEAGKNYLIAAAGAQASPGAVIVASDVPAAE
jgi:uncharacterized surface protein with fasciclin (FAS1) repeats